MIAPGTDETFPFESLYRQRHKRSVRAKHDGEKFVCERLRSVDAIVRHQQPAGQALFQLAAAIANRRLRGLNEEVVGTAQQRAMQADALIQWPCADGLH
jgi:hypothetical protein